MQVTETNAEGLRREFKVVIPAQDMQSKLDLRLAELGRTVRLPGFRPGKVPLELLKQRFGQSVMGEILEHAVNDSSSRLLSDRGLRPAGQPKVEIVSFSAGKDLEYSMAIELIPDIVPMDFGSLELERLSAEVPESEVDEALKNLAARQRKSKPLEVSRPAVQGDILVIDFVGRIEGAAFSGGEASGHHVELGSGSMVPGFEDQLVGSKAGDHIDVHVTFPAEFPNKELAGKAAVFAVDVREHHEAVPVAVDDELAKSLGAENLEGLRRVVRERIERDYAAVSRSRLKRQLLDKLAEAHTFALPGAMVESEFETIWRQIDADRQAGRLDPEDVGKSEEDLKREYREIAERRVKLGLLLSEVGRLNNIQVTGEEVSRAIGLEARRHPGREREVVEFYQRTPQAVAQLRAPIYEEKVVDFILELAKMRERKVAPAEFVEIMREAGAGERAEPDAGPGRAAGER